MKRYLLIFIAFSTLMVSCKKEIEDPVEEIKKFGALRGVIQNEIGQPIEGALVEVENVSTLSNTSGEYSFSKLLAKEYSVSVSKEHYLTKVDKVTIIDNRTIELDLILSAGEPFLSISDSIIDINASKGSISISILSNADWSIKNSSSWLVCSVDRGNGNAILRIDYSANEEYSNRTDSIYFISGQIKRSLIINQSSRSYPIKLVKYEGLIGNREREIEDSVYLLFNKPVKIESIKSNWEGFISEIKYYQTDNNYGVMFSFPGAELGGNYPFTISVNDFDGGTFSENINIPFFKSKFDVNGYITDYLLINDEKEILISAFYPSRLIKYSIALDSVIQVYDLSKHIAPIKMSYNPYNSKIYIMGANPDTDYRGTIINRPDIYTFDLQTGQIIKAITIEPDEEDHPQYPAIFPSNIGFTKSGVGVVLLHSNGSSATRWKLIDCKNGDRIYKYPFYDSTIDKFTLFNTVHMNYDKTKLYLTQPNGSCDYGIFDASTQRISILRPTSTTRSYSLTPYRKSDRFYVRQLYDQFIIDLKGNLSQISYLDSRHAGGADFSYRENELNIVYICESHSFVNFPNGFYLIDYSTGKTLMSCDLIESLEKFSTTLDGELALAYKLNLGSSSSFFVFETKYFHRTLK